MIETGGTRIARWRVGACVLALALGLVAAVPAVAADEAEAYPPPDIIGDVSSLLSWIDNRLTEAIEAGQPESAAVSPTSPPASPPTVAVTPPSPPARVTAPPPASAEEGEAAPLSDLVDWLSAGFKPSDEPAQGAPIASPATPIATASPPTASPPAEPIPAEPVVTTEPLDLTGKAAAPAAAGSRQGLLIGR